MDIFFYDARFSDELITKEDDFVFNFITGSCRREIHFEFI